MSKRRTSISLSAPVIASKKKVPQAPVPRISHAQRLAAEKQSLLALEQSLRLQSYTVRLPRTQRLFSGKDMRRTVFPSASVHVIRIRNGR